MLSQVSLFNTSSSSESEEFDLRQSEMLVDSKDQFWFKWADVGKFLGLVYIHRLTAKQRDEDQETRAFLQAGGDFHSLKVWSRLKDQQNKMENFLSVTATLYVIVNSRKDKGKIFKVDILADIAPRSFDAISKEIQGEDRQVIQERNNKIQTIHYERYFHHTQLKRFQDEIHDLISNVHLPFANYPGKDNLVLITEKNTAPKEDDFCDYPYYIVRI